MSSSDLENKMAKLSTKDSISQIIDETTSTPNAVPGCVFAAVARDGTPLIQHASGTLGVDTSRPMTLESVFWIASCTKMIAGIAAMQLVEQGRLSLDDGEVVEKWCPELAHVRILKEVKEDGTREWESKKGRITLRMLLNHTAGFGYTFFVEKLRAHGQPAGIDEFDGHKSGLLETPLLFEPGTDWEYGTNIDWVGTLIERSTSTSLNTYFQTHIFAPLNLHHITMFPTPQMKQNLAHMHQKTPNQPLRARDHLYRRPLILPPSEHDSVYNSAGAGCFARPTEYLQILSTLLNDGVSPTTGQRILTKKSVDEMFKNQIPQFPDFGRKGIKTAKPTLTNDLPDLYPQPREQPQGWGLTFMLTLHEGATGRGRNTAHWAGLPNLFWWCDREKGVAGILATQILPFGDLEVLGLWGKIEKAIYDGLVVEQAGGQQQGEKEATSKPGLDGYHQEFVANIER